MEPREGPPPGGTPPRSWEEWANGSQAQRGMPDLAPLFALFDALRRAVPDELQDQLNALQRELLLTIRALIDWRLEQLEVPERTTQVEEIPID